VTSTACCGFVGKHTEFAQGVEMAGRKRRVAGAKAAQNRGFRRTRDEDFAALLDIVEQARARSAK